MGMNDKYLFGWCLRDVRLLCFHYIRAIKLLCKEIRKKHTSAVSNIVLLNRTGFIKKLTVI